MNPDLKQAISKALRDQVWAFSCLVLTSFTIVFLVTVEPAWWRYTFLVLMWVIMIVGFYKSVKFHLHFIESERRYEEKQRYYKAHPWNS